LVCPRCRRELDSGLEDYSQQRPGALPRCPEHGLAYVLPADLASAGDDPLLGTAVAGRFVVLSRLGTGSMGSVYRARQEAVGRDVALKIVRHSYHPEARIRFEREARATSLLVSPYTVTVFDFGEAENECWFLALELLNGETLGQRLRREGRLGVDEAVTIARQALSSLAEAHAKGIVHRDLKPDNLFLSKLPGGGGGVEGEVCKVLDFGIAKVLSEEAKIDQLETQAGTVFGTPRYMSPEQAQGRELDARTDIYSLGVLLFRMLAGCAPFVDDDAVVVMARHIENAPPTFDETAPDAGIPREVEAVVRRALAKAPEERFQTADEFSLALEEAMSKAGVSNTGAHRISWVGPPASQSPGSRPRQRRRRSVWLAAVVVTLLLGVTAALLVARRLGVPDTSVHVAASPAAQSSIGSPTESGTSAPDQPDGRNLAPNDGRVRAASAASADSPAAVGPARPALSGSTEMGSPTPRGGVRRKAAERAAPDVRRRPEDRYGRFE